MKSGSENGSETRVGGVETQRRSGNEIVWDEKSGGGVQKLRIVVLLQLSS